MVKGVFVIKTLIITSCTGEKRIKVTNPLKQEDFCDRALLEKREKEIESFSTAKELYTGLQHLRLMEGVSLLRNTYGEEILDLHILSAGYGLISEDRVIAPYEVTFNDMNAKEIADWSDHLNIPEQLTTTIQGYGLVIFLLGEKYIRSLQLSKISIKSGQKLLFLSGGSSKKHIPDQDQYYFINLGPQEASYFSYGLVGLKGYLFKLFSLEMIKTKGYDNGIFEIIYEDPASFLSKLNYKSKI